MSVVYEYILDGYNIITIQQWGALEKPQFSENPTPTPSMLEGKLFDDYGNPLYRLVGSIIYENEIILTDSQEKKKKIKEKDLMDIIRILILGIEDKTNSEFVDLKNDIFGSSK